MTPPVVPEQARPAVPSEPTHRSTLAAVIAAALVVWSLWIAGMIQGQRWSCFSDAWFMSVTMVFGSFIAGATSEGGGAVAFPVMTLFFGIQPLVARDFGLMIQSVGMTSASLTIVYTRIRIERHALLWSSLGGALGVVAGIEWIAPLLPPAFAKMTFLSTWLAFAFALYWINRYHEREVLTEIEHFSWRQAALLAGTGVIGGAVSGITSSGLDIVTFSLLVLRFRICETIATPTSVVLMALNALIGFGWKGLVRGGMEAEAWRYWWVCVPVVVVGAPLGARFIRDRSRLFVAGFLYFSLVAQFVAGLLILPFTPQLAAYSAAVFAGGLLLFHHMARGGVRRLDWLATMRGADPPLRPGSLPPPRR